MRIDQHPTNLDGQVFGRLRVIGRGAKKNYLLCACSCGTKKEIYRSNVLRGKTVSCGCRRLEVGIENRTHGRTGSREHQIWLHMKARSGRPTSKDYENYGGRGITVCERWMAFGNFIEDMGECPDGMSIDRIDNDKGYSPENCRWATRTQQNRNRRNTVRIEFDGESKTLGEWAEVTGINAKTIGTRLASGWAISDALSVPSGSGCLEKFICFRGETKSLKAHAIDAGIPYTTVFTRVSRGWPLERALSK